VVGVDVQDVAYEVLVEGVVADQRLELLVLFAALQGREVEQFEGGYVFVAEQSLLYALRVIIYLVHQMCDCFVVVVDLYLFEDLSQYADVAGV
jgi:hypothetical protein